MKKALLITLSALIIMGCVNSADQSGLQKPEVDQNKVSEIKNLAPLVLNDIVIVDSFDISANYKAEVSTITLALQKLQVNQNTTYLMSSNYSEQLLKTALSNSVSMVYLMADSSVIDPKNLYSVLYRCDSIAELDDKGNEIRRTYNCETSVMPLLVKKIRFYESWYTQENHEKIEKEVLGYTLYYSENNENLYKRNYKVLVHSFKNKQSLEKVKKYSRTDFK
jgi:hypothetical protein